MIGGVGIVACCMLAFLAAALSPNRAARPRLAPTPGGSVFVAPTFPSPATATIMPTPIPPPTEAPLPTTAPPTEAPLPTIAPTEAPAVASTEPAPVELAPAPTAEAVSAAPVSVVPAAPAAAPPAGESATLVRVVDGDTIRAIYNGAEVALRYIGIDTPESKDPGEPVQCFAAEATTYNTQLISGQTLILERDRTDADQYDRLLRYVYLPDGRMVNEELVRAGVAFAKQYKPDTKHAARFEAAERAAQDAGIGLWGACTVADGKTNPVAASQPIAPPQPAAGAASPGGSAAPIDANTCPESHPIKGNQGEAWIYHQPGQSAYSRTNPEACFAAPADAEAAGYRAAQR
jgi:endonuclease YncB( thermonuclease family)